MQAYLKTSSNQYEIIELFYNKESSVISFFHLKSYTPSKIVNDIHYLLLAYINKEIESYV